MALLSLFQTIIQTLQIVMNQKETGKQAILKDIDELVFAIKKKLHQSLLLSANRKLPKLPQPKSIVGGQLKDYQLQSLAWMVELANNNLSGILADDMGLGKTIQGITYMSYLYDTKGIKGKHLIVVPKNVLNNWKRQLQTWCPTFRVVILPGTEAEREKCIQQFIRPSKFDILITTFQSVQSVQRNLKHFNWETMIVDEAHSIKNDETCLATCLRRYKFKFALLMTGTPLSNQLKELWSLLNFIAPDIFFDGRLFQRIQNSVNMDCSNEEEKLKYQSEIAGRFKAIISPFLMRRVKSEINLGLKQKKQFTLFVSLTELQLKMYRNYLKYGSVYGANTGSQMGRHVQLRKICNHPYSFTDIEDPNAPAQGQHLIQVSGKLKLLDKLLRKLLQQKHKILVFSQFTSLLKILQDYCIYRKYKYVTITGESSLEERDSSVQRFSNSKDINIFLISTRAGGIGLNLVAADTVILYDLDWNPQMDRQATDRAYRIGQKNSVKVFRLISINTVEERMLEVQKYKIIWDQLVIQKGGLMRMKAAEEKLEKLDHNMIAGQGAEEIFKLQQNFDDKTIEEIIKIGQEKDKKKTEEIRAKLQKQFQTLGEIANPFESLEKVKSKSLSDINYEAEKVGHVKNMKNPKPIWKQRSLRIQPEPFHLFEDVKKAGELLYLLSQAEEESEKRKYKDEINQMGFYSWSKKEYDLFLKASEIYERQEYSKISEFIETKDEQEVEKYSNQFYKIADERPQLQRAYKKIIKKQQQRQNAKKIKEKIQQIKSFPDHIFNLRPKPALSSLSQDALVKMHYNGLKHHGICLDEQEELMEMFNPNALARARKLVGRLPAYTKIVNQMQQKTQQQFQKQLKRRYEVLNKKYNSSNKKHQKEEQSSDSQKDQNSVKTALKS